MRVIIAAALALAGVVHAALRGNTAPNQSGLSCVAPAVGSNVTTVPCNTAGAGVAWNFTTAIPGSRLGLLSLRSNPSLCLGLGPIYPLSNVPLAVLVTCDTTDRTQMWAPGVPQTGGIFLYNGNGEGVLEVYDNVQAPGTPIEVFGVNGGANQLWQWAPASGQLVTSLDNMCAGVC